MKNKKLIILIAALLVIAAAVVIFIQLGGKEEGQLHKYIGLSHTETDINADGIEGLNAEKAVPLQDELLSRLKDKGYKITTYDKVFDTDISCKRIYAEKDDQFIDICYNLTKDDAEKAFSEFEKKYTKFYVLARNVNYVYCISDKKTFEDAGFKSLATNGVKYLYE